MIISSSFSFKLFPVIFLLISSVVWEFHQRYTLWVKVYVSHCISHISCSSGSGKRKVEEKIWETGAEGRNLKAPQTLQNSCPVETSMVRILCIHEWKWIFWKARHTKGSYFYFNINGLDTLGLIAIFKWRRVWQLDSHRHLKILCFKKNDAFERHQLDRRSQKKGRDCCIIYNRFETAELNMQFWMVCTVWVQMGYQGLKGGTKMLKFLFLSWEKQSEFVRLQKITVQKENRIVHSGLQDQQDPRDCENEK